MSRIVTAEACFNVFLYVNGPDEIIREYGVTVHQLTGTDPAKLRHLQLWVADDFGAARRFPVPPGYWVQLLQGGKLHDALSWDIYQALWLRNLHMRIFEPAFREIGGPPNPLMVVTPVVDGVPRVDAVAPVWNPP